MSNDYAFIDEFVSRLINLGNDQKSRLRRCGRDPSKDPRIFDILSTLEAGHPAWSRKMLDMTASLFAIAKRSGVTDDDKFNFGYQLQLSGFSEQRMKALIGTDSENLYFRLRQAVKFLEKEYKPVNWKVFTKDIMFWSHEDRFIQRKWAWGFYNKEKEEVNKL